MESMDSSEIDEVNSEDDNNMSKTNEQLINSLPDEVLEYILSLISPYKDIKECMLVCKRWYRNVKNVIRLRNYNLTKAIINMDITWQTVRPVEKAPTITKRYSHSACYHDNSMYVFGGTTSSKTTFNDLWKLDLNNRLWVRLLTMGSYPSPKACATMVYYRDCLILFGGWTHPSPSPYPLYQNSRLFNELHVYDIALKRWICINTTYSPPAMAGHSATVHGNKMVVFGGLKSDNSGQHASSNDVWCYNLETQDWHRQSTSDKKPSVRYGQSQISLGESHILIIGGCGGPNMIFSDVWLLTMKGEVWQWREVAVRNPECAAFHMWCHPACKVGNQVVMMSRHPQGTKPFMPYRPRVATSNVWVPLRDSQPVSASLQRNSGRLPIDLDSNVNGQRGSFQRTSSNFHQNRTPGLRIGSINNPDNCNNQQPSTSGYNRSVESASLQSVPKPFESGVGPNCLDHHRDADRMRETDELTVGGSRVSNLQMAAFREQSIRTCPARARDRQLQALQRFEERMRFSDQSRKLKREETPVSKPYRSMTLYVMDISNVLSEDCFVRWLSIRPDEVAGGPEETILYTLVVGRGELIMFGGIQKDAISITTQTQLSEINSVSNSLYFISAPRDVI